MSIVQPQVYTFENIIVIFVNTVLLSPNPVAMFAFRPQCVERKNIAALCARECVGCVFIFRRTPPSSGRASGVNAYCVHLGRYSVNVHVFTLLVFFNQIEFKKNHMRRRRPPLSVMFINTVSAACERAHV